MYSPQQGKWWNAVAMNDEWLLTVADVADALGSCHDDVIALIALGELEFVPGRRRRIAHSELRAYVARMQTDALALGRKPLGEPSLIASQPIRTNNDDPAL
jgi:excisionase family DNA binding protein